MTKSFFIIADYYFSQIFSFDIVKEEHIRSFVKKNIQQNILQHSTVQVCTGCLFHMEWWRTGLKLEEKNQSRESCAEGSGVLGRVPRPRKLKI